MKNGIYEGRNIVEGDLRRAQTRQNFANSSRIHGSLGRLVGVFVDSQRADFRFQRGSRHAKYRRSAVPAGDFASRLRQSGLNLFLLGRLSTCWKRTRLELV